MRRRRLASALVGLVAVAGAWTSAAEEVLPVDGLVGLLGNDYLLVAAVAVAVAGVAVAAVASGREANQARGDLPGPEAATTAPTAGDGLDDALADPTLAVPLVGRSREAVRDRLREAAVATVRRRRNCSEEAARRRVETGAWTDDPVAASFLAEGATPDRPATRGRPPARPDDPGPASLPGRLWTALGGGLAFGSRAGRTAAAVADLGDGAEGRQ